MWISEQGRQRFQSKAALQGAKVDIVTSSLISARRDAQEKAPLFAMFGLRVGHNSDKAENIESFRGCYAADIVYGDVANFQYDVLRDEYTGNGTRGKRVFECVIVDVDSMLRDESGKLAMLAWYLTCPVPSIYSFHTAVSG